MPRLVAGLLMLHKNGTWQTMTANLWGELAVARFSRLFESTPVTGNTKVQLGDAAQSVKWSAAAASATPITRSMMLPWSTGSLSLTQDVTGKPWATVESLAAVALKAPFAAGYLISKTMTRVDPAVKGALSRGDIVRVHLDVDAQSDMTWVVVNDPIPVGATILRSGLGHDSAATEGEQQKGAWPAFVEPGFDGYRAYYDYLPKGKLQVEYTIRVNNPGTFGLPPTRVETLYAPSSSAHCRMRRWSSSHCRASEMKRAAVIIVMCLSAAAHAAPSFDDVRSAWRSSDWVLLARDGTPLQRTHIDTSARRSDWVALAKVSPALREAIVVSEDKRF